jgi:hypothetical protein
MAERELGTGGTYVVTVTAPRRRFWLLTSAAVAMTIGGVGLAAKRLSPSEVRRVPAASMLAVPAEPPGNSSPLATSAGEAPGVPVKVEHVVLPATRVTALRQEEPKAVLGADRPPPRHRASAGKVRREARVNSGDPPEDLKTSL